MPLGLDVGTWWAIGETLALLTLVVGIVVAALALYGALRNESRSMLFLGVGIATLTAGGWAVNVVGVRMFRTGAVGLAASSATELAGLTMILYAIVLARRQ